MTAHTQPSINAARNAAQTHRETPSITPDDTTLYHDGTLYVYHDPGHVTAIGVTTTNDDNGARVTSIVTITRDRPDITPADNVWHHDGYTRIVHGPGRETRVLHGTHPSTDE